MITLTKTEEIIKALEDWFIGGEYFENLVDSIRWLLYNRDDVDAKKCIEWLSAYGQDICEPKKYYTDEFMRNNTNNVEFMEIVGKVIS
ncbi:MAG: hypothetical protein KBT27_16150 [Prevotellaceae bacterium]|nr:hypothetical protein [Candidatus Faecinaster equi]